MTAVPMQRPILAPRARNELCGTCTVGARCCGVEAAPAAVVPATSEAVASVPATARLSSFTGDSLGPGPETGGTGSVVPGFRNIIGTEPTVQTIGSSRRARQDK